MLTYLDNAQNVFCYCSSQCAIHTLITIFFFFLLQFVSLTEEVMRESKNKIPYTFLNPGKGAGKMVLLNL